MGLRYHIPLPGPFYDVFWVVRRLLRNRRRRQAIAQRFPVQQPLPQRPAVEGGPFGLDRRV